MFTTVQKRIEMKLNEAFSPQKLEVINESHLHAGHQHDNDVFDGQGETHFRVRIVAPFFANKTRLDSHRAIYQVLQKELEESVHALAVDIEDI
ncbi:BolA family protein [Bartonella ancashensis]|uniref:Cell division protein BolA n=1 Tax=Bartonella ancashensis TaxID=1318743 RepID=A0A0M5KSF7_9HYPH|nr:BolA family protein [Bartonella ancashensis]ALE03190.1 Cell division protein BolA [Bartonella ancashensis]